MDTFSVYAQNIQPRQIIARIKCQPTDNDAIEYERNNFLKFLNKMSEKGRNYLNQVDAWTDYDNRELPEVYEPDDDFLSEYEVEAYEERYLTELDKKSWLDQKTPDWISRLKQMLIDEALRNAGNYNEYRGQL